MFSQNLKYLRQKHDMEQIDLAHKLGRKSASSISEWEKGKYTPKMATLIKIAEIFNVNIDDLMGEDLTYVESKKEREEKTLDTLAAHLDGELTDEQWEKVLSFARYIQDNDE